MYISTDSGYHSLPLGLTGGHMHPKFATRHGSRVHKEEDIMEEL